MNRSFIMLLALAIFLGAGFGGSFVGGVIYGQNQAENAGDELSPRLAAGGQFPGGGQGANTGQMGQGRQGQAGTAAAQGQGAGIGGQGDPAGGGRARGTEGAPEARVVGQEPAGPQGQEGARPGLDGQSDSPVAAQPDTGGDAANPSPTEAPADASLAAEGATRGLPSRGGAAGRVQGLEGDVLTLASPRGDLAVMLTESTRVFQVSETNREALEAETSVRVIGSRNPEGGIAAQSVVIVPEGVENLFGGGGGPGGRQRGPAP